MTNEDLTKKLIEHEGVIHELTDKIASSAHRLDRQETEIKDLRNLTLAVQRVGDKLEDVSDKVDSIDNRTQKLENEPAENFQYYKRLITGCTITTVLGAIIGALLTLAFK